jgi:hypothetical protein
MTEYENLPDEDEFGGEPTSPDQCGFERQDLSGTILEFDQVPWSSADMASLRDGYWWWGPTEEECREDKDLAGMAGAERVMEDREGMTYKIVTTDGTFYAVSENAEGHGSLYFYKLKNA